MTRERVHARLAVRLGPLSGVWRPRIVLVTLLGLAAVTLTLALNVAVGDTPLSVGEVFTVLSGGGPRSHRYIVLDLRMPRTLAGILVGTALGLSGAITQAVTRNPLASPDVLGVTAGASAASVSIIVLGSTSATVSAIGGSVGVPLAALLGGLLTAALVYALAWRRGIEGFRLVLVGVAIGASATALTSWLLIVAEVSDAARATVWLTGSLNGRGWEHVVPVAVGLAVLVPVALLLSFVLGVLHLGDDTASGLGARVDRDRAALIVVAVALAALATAGAGPIAFVALVVPQICRRLAGTARPPLLTSAIFGALLVLAADVIARTVPRTELPVGIVTAILGAPYLMWLLARGVRGARR
ncbi:FecCD family ABC transporter permease [Nonomuraea longicatena]|uniref:Iron chelate uptake ABC transporter family permease subunit n=1 Tax=Nonomuraea longicatena TaxID=83682 RepID=A0ABN1P8X9_9ACTN